MEKTFAERFAATGDALYAAEKAGYRQPRVRAWENMNDITIMGQVSAIIAAGLDKAAVRAPEILLGIMLNPKSRDADKINASKVVLHERRSGLEGAAEGKDSHELTAQELNDRITALMAEAEALKHVKAERAQPVIDVEHVDIAQVVRNDDDIFQ